LQATPAKVAALCVVICVAVSCNREPEYELLNSDTDCLQVQIEPDGATADDDDSAGDDDDSAGDDDDSAGDDDDSQGSGAQITLMARPGWFANDVLGTAFVTPSSGPAGTRFLITVVLADNGAETGNPTEVVDLVAVRLDNGDLAVDEFPLELSPADPSRWTIELGAGGEPATASREDSLCIAVSAEIE
jgi:hypothetical protein